MGVLVSERKLLEAVEEARKKPLYRFVHSFHFKLMSFSLLLLYAVFIGGLVEFKMRKELRGESLNDWWNLVDFFFLLAFVTELVVRLMADARLFLCLQHCKF